MTQPNGKSRPVVVETDVTRLFGWEQIGAALGVTSRTARKHAGPQARPRLKVCKDPFGRVWAYRVWLERFLEAGSRVNTDQR